MLEDIIIRLDDDFSKYLADIRENEDQRIENERIRNEFFEQLLKEKKMYYGRYRRFYGTVDASEDTFEVPDEYNEMAMLDVYVNGFYLNPNEYRVEDKNVILTKPLNTIGTKVEIVVTRAIGIPTENFEELRGFSAYDMAVKEGFHGTVEQWLRSLEGEGGYKRTSYTFVTSSLESRFAVPSVYKEGDIVDVFVNGFRLSEKEFSIEIVESSYFVVLKHAIDVAGSTVVIDVVQSVFAKLDDELNDASENPVENRAITKKFNELETNIAKNKTDILTNTTNIAKNTTDIATNKTAIETNTTKIASLETDNTTNKADIAKLKTDNTKNKSDIEEAKSDISTLQTDNTSNKAKIATLETDNTNNKSKIASLETDNSSNKANISKLQTDVANLETDKVDKEDGKSLMSDAEIERLKNVDNYNDTEIKQDISDIQSEQITQNETIAEIQEKDVAQDESIELLKQENIEIKQENTKLKAECERLREDANSAPCVSGEGENIKLEGTAEARFKKFSICGNSKQEVREGYNSLPNKTSEELTINGVKFSIHEDGTVSVNGTATANAILNLLDNKTLDLAEGSYFLSGCPANGGTSTYKLDMIEGMSGNPMATDYGNGATLTLTESKSIQQVRIVIYAGATVNNLLFKPMICAGTEQKVYEQYGVSPSVDFKSEIKTVKDSANVTVCNKNLLNTKLAKNKVANGVTFSINEDGSISIKGTAEKYVTLFIEQEMMLRANQTYKAVAFGNKDIVPSLYFITTDNRYLGINLNKDFVYDKDVEVARFYIAVNEGVTIDETVYLMLCNDTTESEYVEHKEQSFTIDVQQDFRKVGDIADVFEKINGVWYERHWIGRYVVTGDENWLLEADGTRLGLYGLITKSDNTARQCSNMFKNCVRWGAGSVNTFFVEDDNIRFHNDFGFESVEEAKAHLKALYEARNPLYFDYVMTEPLDIECTDEQKAVLDEIEKTAKSYKGVTHIFSTDEISPIVHVEARKDMQAENDKMQQEIDNLRQAIVALGGV